MLQRDGVAKSREGRKKSSREAAAEYHVRGFSHEQEHENMSDDRDALAADCDDKDSRLYAERAFDSWNRKVAPLVADIKHMVLGLASRP